MESPYSMAKGHLDELVAEGEKVREELIRTRQSRGEISTAEVLGKIIFQDRRRDIGELGRALRAGSNFSEQMIAGAVDRLIVRLRDIINGLPTGRTGSELKLKQKREFLKKLSEVSRRKSAIARLDASLRFASEISAELTTLEIAYKPRTRLVPSGRPIKGRIEIENIFAKEVSGFLMVCDPYCSPDTLAMLEVTPVGIPISLLTAKVHDMERFTRTLAQMRERGHRMRVCVVQGGPRKAPHDRFIVDEKKGWIIGTSIKDIGNRDSTIASIDNRNEVLRMIEEYMSNAEDI